MKQLRTFGFWLVCVTLLGALSACTTIEELKSTKSYAPKTQREGSVNVASRATGVEAAAKVGKTTVLTLPLGSIKADGDTSSNIMKSIGVALAAAGYNQQSASFNSSDAAYVRGHVEEIAFGNFLAASWATIIIHVRLETRDGAILWKKRQRTHVVSLNNYDRTAVVAMNKLVKDLAQTFAEEDFYTATKRIKKHNEFINEDVASGDSVSKTATMDENSP